jgi:hypothetical protein
MGEALTVDISRGLLVMGVTRCGTPEREERQITRSKAGSVPKGARTALRFEENQIAGLHATTNPC